MRILQVVHQFPPERIGGTELYTLALAQGLIQRGHQSAVFHRAPGSGELAQSEWEGVPVYRAGASSMATVPVYWSTFGQPALSRAFVQAAEQFRPDLIHIQHLKGLPLSVVRFAQGRHIPLVCTLHDYWYACANAQLLTNYDQTICNGPRRGATNCARCALAMLGQPVLAPALPLLAALIAWRNRLLARVSRAAEMLIAPSEFVRRWFVSQGWREDRIQVIPHGIEPLAAADTTTGTHPGVRVACIGGLAWQKGIHTLVEASNGLPGIRLWIAGDETFDPAYVSRLRSLASPDVQFLGRLTRQEVWATLAQADVLAVPSLWHETFSLILHEAFAAGVPVIASNLGALSDAIRHGQDGWLVPAGDVPAWRETLRRLVEDPDLLRGARANIRPRLSQEEHLKRIEALYTRVVGSQGGWL